VECRRINRRGDHGDRENGGLLGIRFLLMLWHIALYIDDLSRELIVVEDI